MGSIYNYIGDYPSNLDAATVVLINAMTTQPTPARAILIDQAVVGLKAASIWDGLDVLWVLAAADSQAALLNWKNPRRFTLAPTNAPTFAADQGYTGDGATSRLDPSWVPSTNGVNFTQDSASLWLWSRTTANNNAVDIGRTAAVGADMIISSATANMAGRMNDNTLTTRANALGGSGFYGIQRTDSATKRYWGNGAQIGIDVAVASTGLTSATIWLCGGAVTGFSARQEAAAAFGSSLSGLELTFYNIMLAYMQGVGAA